MIVPRLRRNAFAIGTAACMAAAFAAAMTAPASAQTTASAAPAAVSAAPTAARAAAAVKAIEAPDSEVDCQAMNGYGNGNVGFWRCTGTSTASEWVWTSCAEVNNNAGSYYNVYVYLNYCSTRVWLHEYTYPDDVNNGWAVCAGPSPAADSTGVVNSADVHPENIQVTGNTSDC